MVPLPAASSHRLNRLLRRGTGRGQTGLALLKRRRLSGAAASVEKWVQTALSNQYELHPLGHDDWVGKLGMCGQGVAFSPKRKVAAAWHAFDTEGKTEALLQVLETC